MQTRVLIIEDNEQNRYMMKFLLEKSGYEVVEAQNAEEGIELAGSAAPALVLLDIQLPIMDGYAVAQALKGNAETAGIPIVMVTSYAMTGDREKGMASGCSGYIEKPIDPENFVSELAQYLS